MNLRRPLAPGAEFAVGPRQVDFLSLALPDWLWTQRSFQTFISQLEKFTTTYRLWENGGRQNQHEAQVEHGGPSVSVKNKRLCRDLTLNRGGDVNNLQEIVQPSCGETVLFTADSLLYVSSAVTGSTEAPQIDPLYIVRSPPTLLQSATGRDVTPSLPSPWFTVKLRHVQQVGPAPCPAPARQVTRMHQEKHRWVLQNKSIKHFTEVWWFSTRY